MLGMQLCGGGGLKIGMDGPMHTWVMLSITHDPAAEYDMLKMHTLVGTYPCCFGAVIVD